jgi:hypothetical protein
MRDFTLATYEFLLMALQERGYTFITFEDYISDTSRKNVIMLRHDVDKRPQNSAATARLEQSLGIEASYYFRIVDESNDPATIREIVSLGHEIGYHYEDMALTGGDTKRAIEQFRNNLNYFREYYPVKTICMHGSPLSKWDNRKIWDHYNYRDFGVIGEPYFDVDFKKVFYLTDTGRRWNGEKVSVRDKVDGDFNLHFRTTTDIVSGIEKLPAQIMITTHPQRWEVKWLPWMKELILQNVKNQVKRVIAS